MTLRLARKRRGRRARPSDFASREAATAKKSRRAGRPARIHRWVAVRMIIVGSLMTLLFAGIAVRAYGIQVEKADEFRELADRQHLAMVEIPAPRGRILDATGGALASTADVDSAYANPREVVDVGGSAQAIAEVLDVDVRELEARLASQRHFVWLKRHLTAQESRAVRALGLPGVGLTPEPRRFYPTSALAGQLLGFAGIDGVGLEGIELSMDSLLTGKVAQRASLRDASGDLLVSDPSAKAEPGATISLTIHRTIQFASERALEDAIRENQASSGVALVLEVGTGNVLAMASWPPMDPNDPVEARARGARNRCITDVYEVGSVMKVFTVAAALEAEVIEPDTLFDVEGGRYRFAGKTFQDSHHDSELTVSQIIKRSSNVGAIKIARLIGAEKLRETLVTFGFGQLVDIELPGEQPGLLRPAARWGDIGLATHSFGYGMTSTPLQVVAALAAIGNGGIYVEPRVVAEVRGADGGLVYQRKSNSRRVVTEETAANLLPMLESVFEKGRDGGTARHIDVPGFRVGGKTGTAHKVDPKTRAYSDDLYLSSFAGLAPIDDPKIAVLVMIDEPKGEHYYGARVAGPPWARIVAETLPYLGVPAQGARCTGCRGGGTSPGVGQSPGTAAPGCGGGPHGIRSARAEHQQRADQSSETGQHGHGAGAAGGG